MVVLHSQALISAKARGRQQWLRLVGANDNEWAEDIVGVLYSCRAATHYPVGLWFWVLPMAAARTQNAPAPDD